MTDADERYCLVETLFILKKGRVRIFRVSSEGRALTTALITPGTIFGEMVLLGQQMHDNFAEALDDVVVCVMARADVHRFLLADPHISIRISEILGRRVAELERRLSDTVFKSVPSASPPPCACCPTTSRSGHWPAAYNCR